MTLMTSGERTGWIHCDRAGCGKEFPCLPTVDQIKASHTHGEGYNPPSELQVPGCLNVSAAEGGCSIAIDRDAVFAMYRGQGTELVDALAPSAAEAGWPKD